MEQAADRQDESLWRKARVVFIVRFVVALACAAALAFFEGGDIFSSAGFRNSYILLLLACVLDLLYVPAAKALGFRTLQIGVQLTFDELLITAIVYLTGGIQSPFTLLYFGPIIAACWLLPKLASCAFPVMAAAGLFAVNLAFHYSAEDAVLPFIPRELSETFVKDHGDLPRLLGNLFIRALAFLAVFLLGLRLLRRVDPERIVIEEIIESMGEGIITVDKAGRIALLNKSARAILDIRVKGSAAGLGLGAVLAGDSLAKLAENLRRGTEARFETVIKRENRKPVAASISTWPIKDEKGRFRGTVAILKDLTLEKEIEDVRNAADRLKGIREMAAGIAHEIRNPLASIRGSIQELTTGALVSEADRKLMGIILKESDRLNNIITEFLELTTKRALNTRLVNLSEVIDEVVTLLSKRPEKGESKIRVETAGDIQARVDLEQMRQVFFNLGLNAIQAMNGKGSLLIKAHPQESVLARGSDAHSGARAAGVSVAFMDTGPGIDKETLPMIFTPFFSTKPKGTGIGLSLAQRSVDAHGGSLRVDTKPGTGTTFTIWIPRNLEEDGK